MQDVMSKTVRELAALVGGDVCGDASLAIQGVASFEEGAAAGRLVWINDAKMLPEAERSAASCILVPHKVAASRTTIIRVAHPKLAFAKIMWAFHPLERPPAGIHPLSVVGQGVQLGRDVSIGPNTVIGDRVVLGDRVTIGAGCIVEAECRIGHDTILYPNVTLYHHTQVGQRVLIHAGCVIGGDGFGFVLDPETKHQMKIPQIGNVLIEDDVELGSNVTVDRGTIGSTILRRGVKVDNLVQIAHNVIIGENTTISAQTGIAGSSRIERNCILAGQVGVADHVTIEEGAIVGAKAGIASGKRIKAGEVIWGIPGRPLSVMKRQAASLSRVPDLLEEVAVLRKALQAAGIPVPTQRRKYPDIDTQ